MQMGGDRCRVLVVDDHVDTLEGLAIVLRIQGHEVETACDGRGAIETAKSFRPHVVLLDISLPDLDGYAVAERIRAELAGTRIHFVAVSGWDREDEKERAREAGFDQHLTKPIDPVRLESLIASMCAAE